MLYDGDCGLCHRGVQYAKHFGKPGAYDFIPNQDPAALEWIRRSGLGGFEQDSVIVIDQDTGRAYVRSAAIVKITARFRWPWRWQTALWLVPRPLRDAGYNQVAKRRKGHLVCKLPKV